MFTITVETEFEAQHQLTLSGDIKEHPHFHQWLVEVDISRAELNKLGLVMDFRSAQGSLDAIIKPLSGSNFGQIEFFKRNNPSAENVARYLFERLKSQLPAEVTLDFVKVREKPGCWAKFSR